MHSVQVFFNFQIYAFSRKLYIPILIWTMVSLCLLVGFGNFISGLLMASLADHNRHWLWLSEFVWSISMATDLTIAATLVFHLHQQRKKVDKRSVMILILLIRIRNYCSFFVALELRC
jgi:ABC-type sugar transport system permease subunit